MSHFVMLVIGDNIEQQLQPYHEYECTGVKDEYVKFVTDIDESEEQLRTQYKEEKDRHESFEEFLKDYYGYEIVDGKIGQWTNPNKKWDWWQIGGRWSGHLILKDKSTSNQAPKQDIDFEAMRKENENTARERYKKVLNGFGGEIPRLKKTWKQAREECDDIELARIVYNSQEAVKRYREIQAQQGLHGCPLDEFQITEEQYVHNHGTLNVPAFGIVKNSKWYERGEMGWFACVSNEKGQEAWDKEFWKIIDSVEPHELITVVDCHI